MIVEKKNRPNIYLAILLTSVLLSCGIEEYYYLPQVTEDSIRSELNTRATVNIPRIDDYHYARYYSIFYRIYTSNVHTDTNDHSVINSSALTGDYNAILPHTDPTNAAIITASNILFRNNNYHELELDGENIADVLKPSGGTLTIDFPPIPGEYPVIIFSDNKKNRLRRSSLVTFRAFDNEFFQNTVPLNDPESADGRNIDVARLRQNVSEHYAYVSMYIVAVGVTPGFVPIFSKPTHISIFKLPDEN